MEEKSQSGTTSKDPIPATQMTSEGSESGATSEDALLEPPATSESSQPGAKSEDPSLEIGTSKEEPSQTVLKSRDLIEKAKNRGIYGFLKIPILLLMLSVLHIETGTLPERRTEIIWEIIQIYIKRAEEKGVPIENPDELLRHLGKLSYDASQRDSHQLMIKKVSIQVNVIHHWQ